MIADGTTPRVFEILMVEDNPGDVELMRISLRRFKLAANIYVASDGERALELLRQEGQFADAARPDIILLDLNLPKLTGTEVLAAIKQDPNLRSIPVAVVTSSHAEEDIVKSYDLHANCYITKPLNFEQCRKMVDAIEEFWFTVVKLPVREAASKIALPSYTETVQPAEVLALNGL